VKSGPKPIPSKLKLLRGTFRPGRAVDDPTEIAPDPELSPPSHLDETARVEWDRVVPDLEEAGLLAGADRSLLAAYCQCWSRWVAAEETLAKVGQVIKTTNGNVVQNPLIGVANRAMELMHRFASEFGMSPSARTRVGSTKKKGANRFAGHGRKASNA
jgi:P27 family predicted phage terminase small subunit